MQVLSRLLGGMMLVALSATAAPGADQPTPFSLVPYVGGYTLDGAQDRSSGTVMGLRLAANLTPRLAFEALGETTRVEDAGVKVHRFGLDAYYRLPLRLGRFTPYLGGGVAVSTVAPLGTGNSVTQGIANYGGGLSYRLTEDGVALRFDLRHLIWLPVPHYSNLAYTVGLSLPISALPPLPPADSDFDRVVDSLDRCPDTPVGTKVDTAGCPLPLDSDLDGVADSRDRCPGTPIGTRVDLNGCPLKVDSDGDGVTDDLDLCPGTPKGTKVNPRGCPLPNDSDGDGVIDSLDRCPGTPHGTVVDQDGCPLIADSDGDGVKDDKDICPGTPPNTPVDPRGCPADSDGDGVGDTIDQCPGTPLGTAVDKVGCPIPGDSDGDGVIDPIDKCPRTPLGTRVNASGCPIVFDSDGDGVIDPVDRCPGTRRGLVVDRFGCPPPTEEQVRINLNIQFATGKADIAEKYTASLKEVGDFMTTYPRTTTEILGHTDNQGSVALNKKLSQKRAESVRQYLIRKYGIEPERIKAIGYGSERPIAENTSAAGRQKNRRIEAVIETVILKPQE